MTINNIQNVCSNFQVEWHNVLPAPVIGLLKPESACFFYQDLDEEKSQLEMDRENSLERLNAKLMELNELKQVFCISDFFEIALWKAKPFSDVLFQ